MLLCCSVWINKAVTEEGLHCDDIEQFQCEKGLSFFFFFCPMLHMTQVKASPDKTPHAQPSQYALTHTNKDRWCACNCQWEVCRLLPQRGDERSRYCQRRGKMTRHLLVLPRPSIRPRKPVCHLNTNYTYTHIQQWQSQRRLISWLKHAMLYFVPV